ncbi:MAG: carbamoyltransferase HypF, partial [Deltaproteobacteria bacterium]|nr:carbamoyltransferase HypF [Deltaproteobacteria bacterium]
MIKRIRCHINGIVQGVGMRPFVYRLANELGLTGHILNQSDGVSIEIQGPRNAADDFLKRLQTDLPQQAHIAQLTSKDLPPESATAFHILESSSTDNKTVYLPPDIATCSACRRDLFNPTDRRYRYPFINCTGCGPRLTIINDIPYDRRTTSMAC